MNKIYINYSLILLLFAFVFIIFKSSGLLSNSIIDSSLLFITKVFPFLFIMMIINELLVSFNLPYYINRIFHSPAVYIFIMSLLGGSPLNAVIIKSLLDKKILSERNASIILSFTTLNNPLFLYNYFTLIFKDYKITLKLFIIIYLSNVLLFIFFKSKLENNSYLVKYEPINIQKSITSAIKNSTINMLSIYGTIVFFKLITDILIPQRSDILATLLRGFTEITQGLNSLTILEVSPLIKQLLALVIISFSGFSIHIQIASILVNYKINYKYFYLSRLGLIILAVIFELIHI